MRSMWAIVPAMYHPWRTLRALTHVALEWRPVGGRYGQTNGTNRIDLHPHQLQVERRCTLTHELVHLESGHTTGCDPRVETSVRAETARKLIALDQLIEALLWAVSLEEAADELWVTLPVLRDRLDHLNPDESARIAEAMLDRDDPA